MTIILLENSDNPPIDFIGIYMTSEGNYYLVQYVSETDNDVKFKYKLLIIQWGNLGCISNPPPFSQSPTTPP